MSSPLSLRIIIFVCVFLSMTLSSLAANDTQTILQYGSNTVEFDSVGVPITLNGEKLTGFWALVFHKNGKIEKRIFDISSMGIAPEQAVYKQHKSEVKSDNIRAIIDADLIDKDHYLLKIIKAPDGESIDSGKSTLLLILDGELIFSEDKKMSQTQMREKERELLQKFPYIETIRQNKLPSILLWVRVQWNLRKDLSYSIEKGVHMDVKNIKTPTQDTKKSLQKQKPIPQKVTPSKPIRVPNTPKTKTLQSGKQDVSQQELEAILKVQKIAKEFDAKNAIHRIIGTSASEVLRWEVEKRNIIWGKEWADLLYGWNKDDIIIVLGDITKYKKLDSKETQEYIGLPMFSLNGKNFNKAGTPRVIHGWEGRDILFVIGDIDFTKTKIESIEDIIVQ